MSKGNPTMAVAIDKDKNSQGAFKWALDNVVNRGQSLALIHVNTKFSAADNESLLREIFVPYRCFCSRKDVQCKDVVLEDTDVARAIIDFVSQASLEKLVIGSSPRSGFVRSFRSMDISSAVCKGVPDFCTVYVISKGKVSSMKNALRPPPMAASALRNQVSTQKYETPNQSNHRNGSRSVPSVQPDHPSTSWNLSRDAESIKSPFMRGRTSATRSYGDLILESGSDISFVSSGRPSVERAYPRLLNSSENSYDNSFESPRRSLGAYPRSGLSPFSVESSSSQSMEDVEAEVRRLRLELKQTMEMYSTACKEALTHKQKAMELQNWKTEEENKQKETQLAEENAMALTEQERARSLQAHTVEASKRIAEGESQKRINSSSPSNNLRYRRYAIEDIEAATENFAENRKIGEGGYGPVYRCHLDHTPVAIKILRSDAAQGQMQFQQEVEILSSIRHPNLVLLLGACPDYGCLVYEHMVNGSLEDRIFMRGNTPPIPWQHRFRIAAEVCTGLHFLHQNKPEPLVHRDLKPANVLLDRNYVSKISDVGLARLVPPSVADNVTQYRMTATAGTFCYIDPEYQQTGMLGIKSDIYSLGILLLQVVTGKPPMGLTHQVERAIERGTFADILDPAVPDWPVEEALGMAEIALKCAELRRKDRPDLGRVVLPALDRLRGLAEENLMQYQMFGGCGAVASSSSMTMSNSSLPPYIPPRGAMSGPGPTTSNERDCLTAIGRFSGPNIGGRR